MSQYDDLLAKYGVQPKEQNGEDEYDALLKKYSGDVHADKPKDTRGIADIYQDVSLGMFEGMQNVQSGIGGLWGLATGDMDNRKLREAKDLAKQARAGMSTYQQDKDKSSQVAVEKAEKEGGFWSGLGEGIMQGLDDPLMAISRQLPLLAVGGISGGATKVAAGQFIRQATEKTMIELGAAGAVASMAAMQGSDIGADAYERVLNIKPETWAKNSDFQALIKQGESEDAAKHAIALREGRIAAAKAAAISIASQKLPGGSTLEKVMMGAGGKGGIAGMGIGAIKGAAGESLQESIEEGGGQKFSNEAVQAVDPTQSSMQGVGGAAGQGAAVAAILGGTAGGASGFTPSDTQAAHPPGASPSSLPPTAAGASPLAAPPPLNQADPGATAFPDVNEAIQADELVQADAANPVDMADPQPAPPVDVAPPAAPLDTTQTAAASMDEVRRQNEQRIQRMIDLASSRGDFEPVKTSPTGTPIVGNRPVSSIPSGRIAQVLDATTNPNERIALEQEMARRGMDTQTLPGAPNGDTDQGGQAAEVAAPGAEGESAELPGSGRFAQASLSGGLPGDGGRAAVPGSSDAGAVPAGDAGAQGVNEFDVSGRTDAQLANLVKAGKPGWREAAIAEVSRRAGTPYPVPASVEVAESTTTKPDEVSAFDQRYPNIAAAEQAIKDKKLKQVAVFAEGDQFRIGAKNAGKAAPSNSLIQRIKQLGGIHTRYRADVIGDKAGAPGLFSGTGRGLDDLATALQAEGFAIDTNEAGGGVDALTGLIQRAVNSGETVLNYAGQQAAAEKRIADDFRDNLKEEIAKLGGNPARNATTKQLIEMRDSLRAVAQQKTIEAAAQIETLIGKELTDADWDAILNAPLPSVDQYAADLDQAALMQREQEENDAAYRRHEEETQVAAGQTATRGARQGAETGRAEPGNKEAQGSQEDFGLTGETPEEIRAREEAQAAKAKSEQDAADKAEAEAKKKRIDAEVASRQQASAENFVLGQGAEDALAGQGDIFGQPAKPATSTETPAGQPAANTPIPAQKAQDSAESDYKDRIHTLDVHEDLFKRVTSGTVTADEFKASFEALLKNKDAIVTALSAMTKDAIFKRFPGLAYRYKSDKKAEVVDAAFRDMASDFVLGQGFSYGMGRDSFIDGIRAVVNRTTDQALADHAAALSKARAERAVRRDQAVAGMADPQTLDDFGRLMNAKAQEMGDGTTYQQVRMTLTPEQRARFDELAGEKTRTERKARADQQKTTVSAPGEAVGASEIIKTKHTKHGHDLWQFTLERRVPPDEFKTLVAQAKRMGGDYSSYRGNGAIPGWQFRSEDAAIAFRKLVAGDTTAAQEVMQARRDAYQDDKSQSAVERLTEMADRLEDRSDESLGQDRKANTARRARFAASAEAAANSDKAMAKTMRNIAQAIADGKAKFLDRVRQKAQVEMLRGFIRSAKDNELRQKYPAYIDYERHQGEKPTGETADYAKFPSYTAFRSDLASLGRQLEQIDGTKKLGASLLKVADDVTSAYLKFAKENLNRVSTFSRAEGKPAIFASKEQAEEAIKRSGFKGKAVVLPFKRGQNIIIMSPSAAKENGIWPEDDDKRITLTADFGAELVEKVKAMGRANRVSLPWIFESAYDARKRLSGIGIETPAEFRAALREFIALQEQPAAPDKIKEMERAMIGRRKDGLDFFPTPASVAREMVETADIKEGMTVLEPSAGMGHIAEQIREAGIEPDVVEMSNDRRELLTEKGFNLVGYDFLDVTGEYDRVVMNPPFSNRRDIEHVRHAYELLKPGGRLVAIMGEGSFFGSDKKATEFRDWLESLNGTSEKLEDGAFLDPTLPVNTGVAARMVVIDKPTEAPRLSRAVPWYSPLNRAIQSAKRDTMPGEQWRLWLQGNKASLGVKDDELQFSGVLDYLALRGKDKVKKGEIADYLAGNGVVVEDVVKAKNVSKDTRMFEAIPDRVEGYYDSSGDWESEGIAFDGENMVFDGGNKFRVERLANGAYEGDGWWSYDGSNLRLHDEPPEASDVYGVNENQKIADDTKFSGYWYSSYKGGIPGTYREILVTLPVSGPEYLRKLREQAVALQEVALNEGRDMTPAELAEWNKLKSDIAKAASRTPSGSFRSTHWDEPNVLVHVRLDEVMGADGKRYVRVGEVQSDWGQAGKKEGFGEKKAGKVFSVIQSVVDTRPMAGATERPEIGSWIVVDENGMGVYNGGRYGRLAAEHHAEQANSEQSYLLNARTGVPNAPFVTDTKAWVALGIKRAIRHAVDVGSDGIVFGTGEQNANLYDLSKQVDRLDIEPYGVESGVQQYRVTAMKDGSRAIDRTVAEPELSNVVGKDIAKEAIAGKTRFEGEGLRVGGEGMRAFYDQIVPSISNEVLKKIGGGKVSAVETEGGKQPGFPIPSELREKLEREGLPLFARGEGKGIALRDLNAMVDRVRKSMDNLPTVHVLTSPMALDLNNPSQARLREFIEQAGALEDVEGAAHEGEIYLFASGLADEARAEHVLAVHEITHYGLRAVFGMDLDPVLQSIWATNANIRKQATALREKLGLASNVAAVEEILADMEPAELVKLTGWRRLAQVVRDWFRGHGFTALADQIDSLLKAGLDGQRKADLLVADVVNAARDWVKGGKRVGKVASGTVLADARKLADDLPAQEKWLNTEARMRGFQDIEDLAAKDYRVFEKLAALWSKKHPADTALSIVWHGTPHIWAPEPGFPHGRPRLDKMGTGEGAQAFGWGFYTATEKDIGVGYKNRLTGDIMKRQRDAASAVAAAKWYTHPKLVVNGKTYYDRMELQGDIASDRLGSMDMPDVVRKAFVDKLLEEDAGSLYQLDIPDATLPYLLDWDKPLSEQTKEVKGAIRPALEKVLQAEDGNGVSAKIKSALRSTLFRGVWPSDMTGEDLYGAIAHAFRKPEPKPGWTSVSVDSDGRAWSGQKAASEYLASLGIVGNRYLDGQSRNRPLKDIKREFLDELPEDADFAEVSDLIGTGRFSPKNDALLAALRDDDWLGFDYPAQAISAALSKDLSGYDASPALLRAVESAKEGGTYNFVIWSQETLDKIALLERNGEKLDAMREADIRLSRAGQSQLPGVQQSPPAQPPSQRSANLQGGAAGNPSVFNTPEPSKMDDIIFKLQDKHIDLKRAIQSITDAGRQIADKWNTYMQEELFHGRTATRVQDFADRELAPMLREMALRKVSIADLDRYLWARHAKEANALIEQRDPGVMVDDVTGQPKGSGMTDQEADDYFAGLGQDQRNQLDAIARKVDGMIAKTRDLYVSYGLENRDTVQGWADMFQHYVPLMREDHDGGMGIGQGFSIKGREAKHRTGSTRAVADVMANIATQRERAIVRGEKNRVAVSLAGLVKLNPAPDFWTLDKIPQERVLNEQTGLVETREVPNYRSRDNVIIAKIKDSNGNVQERAIVLDENDERAVRLAKSMKNIDIPMLEGWLGSAAAVTRYFSAINTQYNPVFGVVNLIRDTGTGALNLSSTALKGKERAVTNPRRIASAVAGIYSDARKERKGQVGTSPWATLWEEFTEEGGQTGYRDMFRTSNERANAMQQVMDPTSWTESKWGQFFTANGALKVPLVTIQKAATPLFNWLSDFNLAMENAVRLSAYKEAVDSGMSKQQAASLAKNLTVNFNRKGAWGAQAGALYAFFNAATQGTARIGETLTRRDHVTGKYSISGVGRKIIGGGVMLGVMQAVALAMAGYDDDEPPEFIRERNIVVPLMDGKYISIPMPLGFHVIPNIGRIATETLMGRRGSAIEGVIDLMGITFEAFNPIGSAGWSTQTVLPTVFDPMAAIIENKDWTGKPIAKEKFSNTDPEPGFAMAKDNASSVSTAIAYAINLATGGSEYAAGKISPTPDQIDYLWGQVTGGVGREGNKLYQSVESLFTGEELPPHKIPLAGRLYGNTKSSSAMNSRFYDNIRDMKRHKAEYMGRMEDGDTEGAQQYLADNPEAEMIRAVGAYESKVQQLRSAKRKAIEQGDSERAREIEMMTGELMERFNQQIGELEGLRDKTQ